MESNIVGSNKIQYEMDISYKILMFLHQQSWYIPFRTRIVYTPRAYGLL